MKKIGLKELHFMARQMKWYEFEGWIAKELYNIPSTVDSIGITDKLFLSSDNNINQFEDNN